MFMCSEINNSYLCFFPNTCTEIHYSTLMLVLLPRDRLISLSYFIVVCDLDARQVRREVRTCGSHCDTPHHIYQFEFLDRHLHIIT